MAIKAANVNSKGKVVKTKNSRSLQYQILQRSLVTNKFLKVSGINSNDNCTFCNSEVETLEHLFWRCQKVQNFWIAIKN